MYTCAQHIHDAIVLRGCPSLAGLCLLYQKRCLQLCNSTERSFGVGVRRGGPSLAGLCRYSQSQHSSIPIVGVGVLRFCLLLLHLTGGARGMLVTPRCLRQNRQGWKVSVVRCWASRMLARHRVRIHFANRLVSMLGSLVRR